MAANGETFSLSTDFDPFAGADEDFDDDENDKDYTPESSSDNDDSSILEDSMGSSQQANLTQDVMNRENSKRKGTENWKQNKNRQKRLKGEAYKDRRGKDRPAKQIGPSCRSSYCEKAKNRACKSIPEETRQKIFDDFWKMDSWDERKTFVTASVLRLQSRKQSEDSRRQKTCVYRFLVEGRPVYVCKTMFCNTLGLPGRTVALWISDGHSPSSEPRQQKKRTPKSGPTEKVNTEDETFLREWLLKLPTVPSHYCRNIPSYQDKRFLFQGTSVSKLHEKYLSDAADAGRRQLSMTVFRRFFTEMKFSVFVPRKDLCDLCTSAKYGNADAEKVAHHKKLSAEAQTEKASDKEKADARTSVWAMDTQAVLLCPRTNASAMYYKTKLQVHNLTFMNLRTKEGFCFLWDETEGDLSSDMFAYIQFRHFNSYLTAHPGIENLVIWSDGCGYQNRNATLANMYMHLSQATGVQIVQKFLVSGHTQMEVDSMHSVIERKILSDVFTPREYVLIMQNARTNPFPYTVEEVVHTEVVRLQESCVQSIRPGIGVGDPTVSEIRALSYETGGKIMYKLSFSDDWMLLPRRINLPKEWNWKRLFDSRRPIKDKKWRDLQSMKHVMPVSVHGFFDNLPRG